jgi:mycothiol synthase
MAIDVAPVRDARGEIERLDRTSRAATGHEALNEATWADIDAPAAGSGGFLARDGDQVVGYAHVSRADNDRPNSWSLGLAVDPGASAANVTTALVVAACEHVADNGGGTLVLWRFAPSDAEDAIVRTLGFSVARELYQMRVPLPPAENPRWPEGVQLRTFVAGQDDAEWVDVNNRAFVTHAEQGGWTVDTLAKRIAEPWFDPSLFLLAVDENGIIGFNWCKLHEATGTEPALGEIFVIGVDDRGRGHGLGRPLAVAGLALMAQRGVKTGMLYCAADNEPALRLYRSLGFTVHRVDRAYERTIPASVVS